MPRRAGFSLSEILIATAILGVGLVMVIAIFPAAIEVNKDSTADVMGTIICENGLATAKAELTQSSLAVGTTFNPTVILPMGAGDLTYPAGGATALRGCLVLARQPVPSRNDYQFMLISYLKTNANNGVKAFLVPTAASGLDSNALQVNLVGTGDSVKVGSCLIDPASGRYSTVVAGYVYGSYYRVILSRPLNPGVPGTKTLSVIVVAETDAGGTSIPSILFSPVTRVMTARAALRP